MYRTVTAKYMPDGLAAHQGVGLNGTCHRRQLKESLSHERDYTRGVRHCGGAALTTWGVRRQAGVVTVGCQRPLGHSRGNPDPSQVCMLLSRPYRGSDLNAGLEWRRDRVRLIAALGCRTCEDGALRTIPGAGTTEWLIRADEPKVLLDCPAPTRCTTTLELPHA